MSLGNCMESFIPNEYTYMTDIGIYQLKEHSAETESWQFRHRKNTGQFHVM